MAAADDYFGTGYIGFNPFQANAPDQQPDQEQGGNIQPYDRYPNLRGLSENQVNDETRDTMTKGTGGTYQPNEGDGHTQDGGGPSDASGGGEFPDPPPEAGSPPFPAPPGYRWKYDQSQQIWTLVADTTDTGPGGPDPPPVGQFPGTTPPQSGNSQFEVGDLKPIRDYLQNWLINNGLNRPNPYLGQLTVPTNPMLQGAYSTAMQGFGTGGQYLDASWDTLARLYDDAGNANKNLYPLLQQAWNQTQGITGATGDLTSELMRTGGAPDITSALNDIRSKGMLDIQNQLAQLREQYGQMGLGDSSDIAAAQARGAATGIADINSQQSQLIAQILSQAQDRRLGAGNLAFQSAAASPQVMNSLLNTQMQANLSPMQLQSQVGSLFPQIGQAYGNLGNATAANLLNQGNTEMQRQGNNQQILYQEYLRTQNPQYLNQMLSFATGFPPTVQQPVVNNTSGSGSIWGSLGTAAIAALPWIIMAASSRELKEEITPAKPVLTELKKLPIYNWKYKGDKTKHLGPMAEDFQEAFGVGDGKSLHLVDVFGVMLSAMKEMANA